MRESVQRGGEAMKCGRIMQDKKKKNTNYCLRGIVRQGEVE